MNMGWVPPPIVLVIVGSAIVALAVGIAALRKRPDPMALPLALGMFAIVAWAGPHALSMGSTDPEWVFFWERVRYPGTVFAPVLYLIIALRYTERERYLSIPVYGILALVPTITIVAVWTNQYHGLFWREVSVTTVSGVSVVTPEVGPWYSVNLGFLYILTTISLVLFASEFLQSTRIYRKQAAMMFLGGLIPLVTNAIVNTPLGFDLTIDLTTVALTASGVTFALALFYLDLIELRPVARNRLFEELEDGVVVIGPNGKIRDFNSTAAHVLGDIEVEQPATHLFPEDINPDGGELVVDIDGNQQTFRCRARYLTDRDDRQVGRIFYLNNVTELVEREQRISVLNRVLRHNIRNELNVVSGRLELLQQDQFSEVAGENIDLALEKTKRVIEIAEKARQIERTVRTSDTMVPVRVGPVLESTIANVRSRYPDVSITYESATDGSDITISVVDENLLEMSIVELIENAIVHNERPDPTVTVRVDVEKNQLDIVVIDNGPEIPDAEIDILGSRTESGLQHASGIGLWLVQWTASLSAGDLSFSNAGTRGNIVTLSFPLVED